MTQITLEIDEDFKRHLESIARHEQKSVEEIAGSALKNYAMARALDHTLKPAPEPESTTGDIFLLIADAADKLGATSGDGSISERSREILAVEYAENLMRRMKDRD